MYRAAILAALTAALMPLSCGERPRFLDSPDQGQPQLTTKDGSASIDRLKPERMVLVLTRRQGQSSLMAVASASARQWNFQDICQGTDSVKIDIFLSNGKRLSSPMTGDPRYEIVDDTEGVYRRAVWRWAWHSLADSCLSLADSSATVDSATVMAKWESRLSGQSHRKTSAAEKIPVSLSRKQLD